MTHFPHPRRRTLPERLVAPTRSPFKGDVTWGRPLFRAPALPSPGLVPVTPFTPARIPSPARRG